MRIVDFILNHIEFLIPVVILVISALSSTKKKNPGRSTTTVSPQQRQQQEAEERRVREIQEEIRRKIAERTGAGASTPQRSRSQPVQSQTRSREPQRSSQSGGRKSYERHERTVSQESGHKEYERYERPVSQTSGRKFMPEHDKQHGMSTPVSRHREPENKWAAEVEEQERKVEEQLRKAKQLRGRLKQKDPGLGAPIGAGGFPSSKVDKVIPMKGLQAEVLADLRNSNGQRKAILLREILDKPIGMRKPGTSTI